MQGSLEQPPIVIRGKRWFWIRLSLVGGLMVALCVYAVVAAPAKDTIPSLLCLAFFGFMFVGSVSRVFKPARLEIGPAGIVQQGLNKTRRFAWDDVYNFRTASLGVSTRVVGFDYVHPAAKAPALFGINTAMTGVQDCLASNWDVAPQALADLLNGARERWVAAPAAAGATAAEAFR
jgi:hypothetical protein